MVFAALDRALGFPYLRYRFRRRLGYPLDLKSPRSFNEKIQWRKVYDRNPVYPLIADKIRMQGFVADLLGPERCAGLFPRLLGETAWPTAEWLAGFGSGIAIKANHGSGWNIIVRPGEQPDWHALAGQAQRWLRRRHGVTKQEWAYWQIPPRIMVEELLLTAEGRLADDLKFQVFDGVTGYCHAACNRFEDLEEMYFTRDWQPMDLRMRGKGALPPLPRPPGFERMREIAEDIGRGFDYIRVDFLIADDRFALNELTLYRASGFDRFNPESYDHKFGVLWHLPELNDDGLPISGSGV